VTDPVASPRTPLTRPHPETNPFQRPDRIAFSSPVATIGFARHEWPIAFSQTDPQAAITGLLCNPNPAAGSATANTNGVVPDAGDLGIYYRPNSSLSIGPPNVTGFNGPSPYRLRGIFAFATLSTGAMVAIDVDDWDAPCRRPDPVGGDTLAGGSADVSAICPAQPDWVPTDLDPYHARETFQKLDTSSNVTLESFFPVSAPNRTRSADFLRNDPSLGNFQPRIDTLPQLFSNSATVGLSRSNDKPAPFIIPTTDPGLVDPNENSTPTAFDPSAKVRTPLALPNVRFSFESPEVHLDQDWTVTFEGSVPGFQGITGELKTTDAYQSIMLSAPSALFCRRGVEDYRLGQDKANAVASAATSHAPALVVPDRLQKKTADYVQIIDDILANTDPYWGVGDVNQCWEGSLADDQNSGTPNASASAKVAADRYNACANTFGSGQDVNPVMSVQRDFPILEASQNSLVLGRFGYPDGQPPSTQTREIVAADKSNAPFLKLMQCCFHNQFQFNVRAGNEWVVVGTKIGFLHHVTEGTGGACVLSCNARDSLMNGRAPVVSSVQKMSGSIILSDTTKLDPNAAFARNSALAMRNPMFSFVALNGAISGASAGVFADVYPDRDEQWRFTSRGQFVPLTINLAQTTSSVSPQSTKFVEALGQLAVVDGSAQGLILIDLDQVTFAHSPYF
jgi:hypothetical protein